MKNISYLILLAYPMIGWAGFTDARTPPAKAETVMALAPTGQKPVAAKEPTEDGKIRGAAYGLPLAVALSQAFPGKELSLSESVANKTVTWKGAYDQDALLALLGSQAGARLALIDGRVEGVENTKYEVFESDQTLSKTLERWGKTAGWVLVWDTDFDLMLAAKASYQGSFEDAIQSVFAELSQSRVPLKATMYTANKVLRVTKFEGVSK